jgi:hypothetical protein
LTPSPIRKALSTIQKHRVAHLLMGGQACVLYGEAEFSRDLDLALLPGPANLGRLDAALDRPKTAPSDVQLIWRRKLALPPELPMTTLYANFDGQVLRPEEPISLPPNTRVRLLLEPAESAPAPADARSFLDVALSLELEGPPDWSARFDEYLYGSDEGPEPRG